MKIRLPLHVVFIGMAEAPIRWLRQARFDCQEFIRLNLKPLKKRATKWHFASIIFSFKINLWRPWFL
jgi:hypothetical protein